METLTKTDIEEEQHGHAHGQSHYVKIWALLLVLLAISVIGPFLGPKISELTGGAVQAWVVTLVTAFGIALYKAYLVAANFMHLNIEKKYVNYMLLTMIAFMLLFFAGVAPDVMKHKGQHWENVAAEAEVQRGLQENEEAGQGHGEHHGESAH